VVVRDQSYCLLHDGSFFAVHGDQVLRGTLHGDLAFAVDPRGPYTDGRTRYSKPYAHSARTRIQDSAWARIESVRGTSLPAVGVDVDVNEVDHVISVDQMRENAEAEYGKVLRRLEEFVSSSVPAELAGGIDFGLTGSVGLGLTRVDAEPPHDWDVVVTAPLETQARVVRALQDRAIGSPAVRIQEYGKGWLIRQSVDGELLCPFFRVNVPELLNIHRVEDQPTTVIGIVIDARRAALVPLGFTVVAGDDQLEVLALGLRSRGDLRVGDSVRVCGYFCQVSSGDSPPRKALICIEDAPQWLVDPPWEQFYE
jgi:hypothetical protein